MNVVIVSDHGRVVGGAEKVALTTAAALHDAGHRIAVFAGDDALDPLLTERPEIKTGLLGLPNTWNRFFAAPRAQKVGLLLSDPLPGRALRAFLKDIPRGDTVVHVHSYRTKLGAGALSVPLAMGFPTVLTMHDYGFACPNSTFFIYPEGRICPLRGLSRPCRQCQCIAPGADKLKALHVARLLGQNHLHRVPQRLKHYIAVSGFSLDILRSYLPRNAQATVLPNPVDAENQGPSDVRAHDRFLFVGRLTDEKDPVTVARAAHATGVPIRFAGDGPAREKVHTANPEAELLGWLGPEEIRPLYRQARALVMASVWYETAGLVVLEALSQGVPVIVSDKCASREYVADGETGLWYSGGDERDLQAKLRVMTDPQIAEKMGRAAYERYWQNPPTMDAHLARLTAIYENMLKEKR